MTRPAHFMVSECDGALYDTRAPNWSASPPLRPVFAQCVARIDTAAQFKAALRHGPYAWPGGYPLFFLMADGEALSFEAARQNLREIFAAFQSGGRDDQWRPVDCSVNWEDSELICAHSGARIPAAYDADGEA